jgi:hypothetical protein
VERSRRTAQKVERSIRGNQSSNIIKTSNGIAEQQLQVPPALGDSKDEGGLGAALWQEDEHGIKQVIGYASRRLTASEKNYPAFIAEMQAAVYEMTYFQHY